MPLSPEDSERLKRVVKYALAAGLGAAAVYNVQKGDRRGHFRPTQSKERFYMLVIKEGRNRINQITGRVSDFEAAISGKEVEIEVDDDVVVPSGEDIEEFVSTFIDDPRALGQKD